MDMYVWKGKGREGCGYTTECACQKEGERTHARTHARMHARTHPQYKMCMAEEGRHMHPPTFSTRSCIHYTMGMTK